MAKNIIWHMSQSFSWVVYNIIWRWGNILLEGVENEKIKVTSRRDGEMGPGAT
jgi:hypothetical protein